jgi:hypothetical protein
VTVRCPSTDDRRRRNVSLRGKSGSFSFPVLIAVRGCGTETQMGVVVVLSALAGILASMALAIRFEQRIGR